MIATNSNNWLLLAVLASRKFAKSEKKTKKMREKIKIAYLMYLRNQEIEKEKSIRALWTRPIYSEEKRFIYGSGTVLFCELQDDVIKFFNYFRMLPDMFYELLNT